ncbi:hypothetical protein OsJ_23832 [Oryza sativa Japonica Group]|uniref:Uncharacterized protein n=1 Tax=Oryza sativa subsp. japonica TaxID=39947 RepID=B9FWM2_ORYSJ|nr:hypothetical protein OsJ_23832 [Oryza sativa Japonica Group]
MDATDPPPPPPPLTRKRGREARKSKEAAPPREPRRARSRSHVPPPPGAGDGRGGDGEEDVGFDLISRLPDAVLGDIISRLPTKDGGKTRALSKRWRPVWRTAPLNLDAGDLAPDANGAALAVLVTQILLVHAGPVRRFCIPAQQIHERPAMVEGWLGSRRFKNLEELEFTVPGRPPSTGDHSCCSRPRRPPSASRPPSVSPPLANAASQTAQPPSRFGSRSSGCSPSRKSSSPSILSIASSPAALHWRGCCSNVPSDSDASASIPLPLEASPSIPHAVEITVYGRLIHIERAMGLGVNVTVIAAPKLEACVLDDLDDGYYRLDFGKVVFKGFAVINYTTPVSSIKILALIRDNLRHPIMGQLIAGAANIGENSKALTYV